MKKIKLYGKLDLNEIITVDDSVSKENLEELLANYVVDNTDWSYEEINNNNDSIVDLSDSEVALFTTKAYDKTTSMIYDILGFTKMPEETLLRLYNKEHDMARIRRDTDVVILRNTGLFDKNGELIYEYGLYLDEVEDEYFTVIFKDGGFVAKYDDWEISLSKVCDTAVKIAVKIKDI